MTPLEHNHNIDTLIEYRASNYQEYSTLLYNEYPSDTFMELSDPPDIIGVQTNQEFVLLITEVELITLRAEINDETNKS